MAVQITAGPYFWDPSGGPGSVHRATTTLIVSGTAADGADLGPVLEQLRPGDVLHLDQTDDPAAWWVYTVVEVLPAAPVAVDQVLHVDNYGGGFCRVLASGITGRASVTVALATTPGTGGAVYPSLGDIPDAAAVWADFAGSLGHMRDDAGDVLTPTLVEWIRDGMVLTVHRDDSDPAHPVLKVTDVRAPVIPGAYGIHISSGGHGTAANPADGAGMTVTVVDMDGGVEPPAPPVAHLVTGAEVAAAVGLPAPDASCDLAAATAEDLLAGYLRPEDPLRPWSTVAPVVAAAQALAVDVYQARTAVGGDATALDYTPGPRMGWTLLRRHAGLLAPYTDVRGMVG